MGGGKGCSLALFALMAILLLEIGFALAASSSADSIFPKLNATVEKPWEKQSWYSNPFVANFLVFKSYAPELYYSVYMLGLENVSVSGGTKEAIADALARENSAEKRRILDRISFHFRRSEERLGDAKAGFGRLNPIASQVMFARGINPRAVDAFFLESALVKAGGALLGLPDTWDSVMGDAAGSLEDAAIASDYATALVESEYAELESTGLMDDGSYVGKALGRLRVLKGERDLALVSRGASVMPPAGAANFSRTVFAAGNGLAGLNALLKSDLPLVPQSRFRNAMEFSNNSQFWEMAAVADLALAPALGPSIGVSMTAQAVIEYYAELELERMADVGEGLAENGATYQETLALMTGSNGVVSEALRLHAIAESAMAMAEEECEGEANGDSDLAGAFGKSALGIADAGPEKFDYAVDFRDSGATEAVPVYVGGTFAYRSGYLGRQAQWLDGLSDGIARACSEKRFADAYGMNRTFGRNFTEASQTLADLQAGMDDALVIVDSEARKEIETLRTGLEETEGLGTENFAQAAEKYENSTGLLAKAQGMNPGAKGAKYELLLNAYFEAKEGIALLKPQGEYLQSLHDGFAARTEELESAIKTAEKLGLDVSLEQKELENALALSDRMAQETNASFIISQTGMVEDAVAGIKGRAKIAYSQLDGEREFLLDASGGGKYYRLSDRFYGYERFASENGIDFDLAFPYLKEMGDEYGRAILEVNRSSAAMVEKALDGNLQATVFFEGERTLDGKTFVDVHVSAYNPLPIGSESARLEVPFGFGFLKDDLTVGREETQKIVSLDGQTLVWVRAPAESMVELVFRKGIVPAETIRESETVKADAQFAVVGRKLEAESITDGYLAALAIDNGSTGVSLAGNGRSLDYSIVQNDSGTYLLAWIDSNGKSDGTPGKDTLTIEYSLPEPYLFSRMGYAAGTSGADNYSTTVSYEFILRFKRKLGERLEIEEYEPLPAGSNLTSFSLQVDGRPDMVAEARQINGFLAYSFLVNEPNGSYSGRVSYTATDPKGYAELLQAAYGTGETQVLVDSGDYPGALKKLLELRAQQQIGNWSTAAYKAQYEEESAALLQGKAREARLLALSGSQKARDKVEKYSALASASAAQGDYEGALENTRKASGVLQEIAATANQDIRDEYNKLFKGYNAFKQALPVRYANETDAIDSLFSSLAKGLGNGDGDASLALSAEINERIGALNRTYVSDLASGKDEALAIGDYVRRGLDSLTPLLEAYTLEYNKKVYPFTLTPNDIKKRMAAIRKGIDGWGGTTDLDSALAARRDLLKLKGDMNASMEGLRNLTARMLTKAGLALPDVLDKAKKGKLQQALEAARKLFDGGSYSDALVKAQGVYADAVSASNGAAQGPDIALIAALTGVLLLVIGYYYWTGRKTKAPGRAKALGKEKEE